MSATEFNSNTCDLMMTDIHDEMRVLLEKYPRMRPPLSAAYNKIYKQEYKANREGKNFFSKLSQISEKWMHKKVAQDNRGNILEIGAGTLNHIPYELQKANLNYDIIEPFRDLFFDNPLLNSVGNVYSDIRKIPITNSYDRIISIAVLEHLVDLPFVISKAALLLKPDGIFQNGIPSEGEWLWGFSWRITTGIGFRWRTGLSYAHLMRHEHVNTADEILKVMTYFFKTVRIQKFPFPVRGCSIYTYLCARDPYGERCKAFLKNQNIDIPFKNR